MITIIKNKDKLDIVHEKIEEKIFLEDLSFNGFFDKFIGNFISRQSLELLKSNMMYYQIEKYEKIIFKIKIFYGEYYD